MRAAGDLIDYEITPAFDMYPAIANGTSIVQGARTKAGQVCKMTIDLGGSADQQNAIQAASWLLSIGDWHKKNVSGTMVVRGKRLTELILGSKTDSVAISITGLTLSDCGSMQVVLLSNISTLQGTIDFSACLNMRKIYADGTGLSQIKLPEGGGLELIEYPAGNKYLTLRNFPVLTAENVIIDQCATVITDFFITGCPLLNPMDLLVSILSAQAFQGIDHALKRIRAVGFDATYTSNGSQILDMLGTLTDGTYEGLNSDGLAGEDPYPVLDGKITVKANTYEDTVNALRERFTKLTLVIDGAWYIRFADNAVKNIVVNNWGDGVGITKEQAAKVTTLGNKFQGNSEITSFDEFQYFTGVTSIGWDCFGGCSNMESITFPEKGITITRSFDNCTKLKRANNTKNCIFINASFFYCSSLETIDLSNSPYLPAAMFSGCYSLKTILFPKHMINYNNSVIGNVFSECRSLVELDIPEGITSVGYAFVLNCNSLKYLTFPSTLTRAESWFVGACPVLEWIRFKSVEPPTMTITKGIIANNSCVIYVPSQSVEAYKNANYWKDYADRIAGY